MSASRWILAILLALAGLLAGLLLWSRGRARIPTPAEPARERPEIGHAAPSTSPEAAPEQAARESGSQGARGRETVETPPEPVVLAGVVLDFPSGSGSEGAPAGGVSVGGDQGFATELDPVVTDPQGRFRMEVPDSGRRPLLFTLIAGGNELLRGAAAEVMLKQDERESLGLVLKRYPKGDLVGVTVDVDDVPVPRVRLVFHREEVTGRVVREVSSDDEGAFRLENVGEGWLQELQAEREGYLLLRAPRPQSLREGGWEPMRVVLGSTGRLRIQVVGPKGEPIPSFAVSVGISALERHGRQRDDMSLRPSVRMDTDASGSAYFERVWADQRLVIDVHPASTFGDSRSRSSERAEGERLLLGDTSAGQPIVVRPGEVRDLRAVIPARILLRGRVQDEESHPVPEASLKLTSPGASASERPVEVQTRADAEGRFSIELPVDRAVAVVRVTASDKWDFGMMSKNARIASTLVDTATQSSAEIALASAEIALASAEIVLVLRRALAIRGRLLGPDGGAVKGTVSAFSQSDESKPFERNPQMARGSKDGSFAVYGLGAGAYDLLVAPEEPYAETWVREIEAGRNDLDIRLEKERTVRVAVEVALREGEPGELIVLRARLRPHAELSDVPRLASTSVYGDPKGWPEEIIHLWYGSEGWSDGRGVTSGEFWPIRENPTVFRLDEGYYWLGAKGKDKAGHLLFPTGTGLVHLDAGEYRVRFELAPAVQVEGRVRASDLLALAVGIAGSDGKLLELDTGGDELQRFRQLGADGWFSFAAVPVGDLELQVGSPAELQAGRPSHRQPLVVKPDGVPFLEIALNR